ncbi:Endonuclease V [Candidatus Korarchaeum cryptofilum OPF8]|jgi:endonuclease V-like protein UPF0215 family|uniref:UPF0215 protein Kcr_1390 n=1 Tax=Korarchaeum cryptofilum (strain OPF8) TaxID=374847 RepID=B1L6Q7_KORCO|nr:Endonuclease V [Candidatus Korarchaeum cryptofilum OPF8]
MEKYKGPSIPRCGLSIKGRILAVDDSPFERGKDADTFLVGIMFRDLVIELSMKERISVDGDDSTEALIRMVRSPKLREEVRVVMSHGTTFAGLNVVDVSRFYEETGIPLIAVTSKVPTNEIERAIVSAGMIEKLEIVRRNPPYNPLRTPKGVCFYSTIGMSGDEAERVILRYIVESKVPEQLRIVDIVSRLLAGCRYQVE